MKKHNKQIALTLTAAFMLALLSGCGQRTPQPATPPTLENSAEPQPSERFQPEATEPVTAGEGGKTLVVYYSATGSTETVAGYIADTLKADTFAITPAEPYNSDDLNWSDKSSRVSQEHDDPSLRAIELTSTTVDNWDSYDTVFIGYPIWWGIAAWPVDSFISANDFTGKTVIPFCTSSSSSFGDSGNLLAELAGAGDWQDGHRFHSGINKADVTQWIDDLNLIK